MRSLIFICCGLFTFNVYAAGFLVEPYGGYSSGQLAIKYSDSYTDQSLRSVRKEGSINGSTFGGRVAIFLGPLFIGGDYQLVNGKRKFEQEEGQASNFSTKTTFGILGLQSSNGLRLFAGMSLNSETTEATLTQPRLYQGLALKVGLGLRRQWPVAINVEYVQYNNKKHEQGDSRGEISELFKIFNYSSINLTVSLPLSVGL